MPTNNVFLIRPKHFGFNSQTADNNSFQSRAKYDAEQIQAQAVQEFNLLVDQLESHGVQVLIFEDSDNVNTPDAVFPNNWISTHDNGIIALYPMYAENRRLEIRSDIVNSLSDQFGFNEVKDWSSFAEKGIFLEGTGSLVLDRYHSIAYCCLSIRSDAELAEHWADEMGYELLTFQANDRAGNPIYHTNVMMTVTQNLVLICLESIPLDDDRDLILDLISATSKRYIPISMDQLEHFSGNMIELVDDQGKSLLVMSQTAKESLNTMQIEEIERYSTIVSAAIPTIEQIGGGSVRCMIAEIYGPDNQLPK